MADKLDFDQFNRAFCDFDTITPKKTNIEKYYFWYCNGFEVGIKTQKRKLVKLLGLEEK